MFDSNNFTLSSMHSFQNAWPIKRKAVYTLVLFHIFIHLLVRIRLDHNPLAYFLTLLFVNLQAVRGITSGGKFYQLPLEVTGKCDNATSISKIIAEVKFSSYNNFSFLDVEKDIILKEQIRQRLLAKYCTTMFTFFVLYTCARNSLDYHLLINTCTLALNIMIIILGNVYG